MKENNYSEPLAKIPIEAVVQVQDKLIKMYRFEIGQLKSEIDELRSQGESKLLKMIKSNHHSVAKQNKLLKRKIKKMKQEHQQLRNGIINSFKSV